MVRDLAIHKIRAHSFERLESPGLIRAHHPAVADYIGSKNGTQATFHITRKRVL